MDFNNVIDQIKTLENEAKKNKIDTQFEKNKLYNYLGDELVEILKGYNAIIAGGLVSSIFTNKEINDVDVYFRNEKDLLAFVEDMWNDGKHIATHTKKATLFMMGEVSIQVIHFDYFKNADEIFNTFDFTVCMGAFDFKDEEYHLHKDFLKHNSQRILKFNKGTSFPLVSLMRVKKYEQEKGFKISKPELMRIALTCMNLNINSYEELKDHLGGLYGESYENMFKGLEDEEFSLDKAIDYIANLHVSDDYFKEPVKIEFSSLDDLISSIANLPFRYFEHDGADYRIGFNGSISRYYDKLPENAEKVDKVDYFNDIKLCKCVRKKGDGEYRSFFDANFAYKMGEVVEAKSDVGLFFNTYKNLKDSPYLNDDDMTVIEVSVDGNDFKDTNGSSLVFQKCKMLREVPESEWLSEWKVTKREDRWF